MAALMVDTQTPLTRAEPSGSTTHRLVVVVGFDGSQPAHRALDAATRLISGRLGSIRVVYVAHSPVASELAVSASAEMAGAFDAAERQLAETVRARLEGIGQPWYFQRRDGAIAHELIATADELSRDYGEDTSVVIVVGSATHAYHHVVGSVPVALVRHATYPVVVVP